MLFKCIVILFILSLTSCNCGLLNWFSGLTDELNPENEKIFPIEAELKQTWFILLGFPRDKILPKFAHICSDHFTEEDFVVKEQKYLKHKAIPIPVKPTILESLQEISSDSTVGESPPRKKCKEKREAEENGIKPDITDSGADKSVSLMDIDKGKLTTKSEQELETEVHQGHPKAKRCCKGRYTVSAYNPVVGAARRNPKFLPLVKRNSGSEERCNICREQPNCKFLGQCAQCNEDCKGIAIFTDDLLTPWTNQSVGMASPNKDDIFSKTLYPMSTFRDGETKEIICRIVGITDTSDIETVTIWVTTFSNTPPRSLNGMIGDRSRTNKKSENTPEQSLSESAGKLMDKSKMHGVNPPSMTRTPVANGKVTPPQIKARFNDYDDEDGSSLSKITNSGMEKIKANPDLIEGPPPFSRSNALPSGEFSPNHANNLRSNGILGDRGGAINKPIVVQPKEFESDESDDDDDYVVSVPSSPAIEEPTTTKNIIKPTLLSKLRELATSRASRRQKYKKEFPARDEFIKNFLKSRQDATEKNPKMIISTPSAPSFFQKAAENKEEFAENENQIPSTKFPGENNDQIAKINEALQEVKSMVKNIQDEASKASNARLLGASQNADISEDLPQHTIATASMPSFSPNQIDQVVPSKVVDNIKKVNQYIINRAQDALDMIRPQEKTDQPSQPPEIGSARDEHSEITKNTITNFKKMPQFFLDKFKDTLNSFENKQVANPVVGIESNSIKEEPTNKDIELTERFGGDDVSNMDPENNIVNTNIKVRPNGVNSDDESGAAVVGLPKQNVLENDTGPNIETSTTKTYKNKLEKYLAELKNKRQRIYSPDKYLKSSFQSNKMTSSPMGEEVIKSTKPSNVQNFGSDQKKLENNYEKDKDTRSNILRPSNDLEKQRQILRENLKKFINGAKSKTSGSIPLATEINKTTPSLSSTNNKNIINNRLVPPENQYQKSNPVITGHQTLPGSIQSAIGENYKTTGTVNKPTLSQNIPQNILNESGDQMVGKSNSNNNQEVSDIYQSLPTIPIFPNNEVNQNIESPNKFKKYLDDLKTKQSLLLKPKETFDNSFIQSGNLGSESENQLEGKKETLRAKIKSYVDNLKKPIEDVVGQPAMSLNQRMADQVSNLNNKVKNDMKNLFRSSSDVFPKDVLKEKLKKYVDSLKKPMGSRLVPDLVRRTSEAQREELDSLKRKLESLLKAKEPSESLTDNVLVSKTDPNFNPPNLEAPLADKSITSIKNRVKTTDVPNNVIVGDTRHSALNEQLEKNNDEMSWKTQITDNQNKNLQSRGSINEAEDDNLDWSHSLGKIVQSSSKPSDIFFIGSGIKLPLQVTPGLNGSMDLSVDLEKLCSCYNATCPKNHSAIEETVGEILQKEAELNEQLKSDSLDYVKVENRSPLMTKPVSEGANFNKKPTIRQRRLNNMNANTLSRQKRKTNIFKRSSDIQTLSSELTTIKTGLEKLKNKDVKNMENDILNASGSPKLPTLDIVADELANLGKKVHDSFTSSVQQLKNNIEELKEGLEDTFVGVDQNPNLLLSESLPTIPTYNDNWFQDSIAEMTAKVNEINKNALEKLEHENTLNNLLNVNGFQRNSEANLLNNEYRNNLKASRMFEKLLKTNGLNEIGLSTESPLNLIENQANHFIKNFERENTANLNKMMRKAGLDKFQAPKKPTLSTTDPLAVVNQFQENLKKSLPSLPELQNKMNEMNDDIGKITDTYQFGKTNLLEKKLKQLDNEVKKYYEDNEKLLEEESQKLFGGLSNEIAEKEVNIINRVISWIKGLTSRIQE